jgi:diguanylate cyclase (GGDEF)-like protein
MSKAVIPPARESRRLREVQELQTRGAQEEIASLALKLAQEADELEERALLDSLTRVWNRGAIMELAARELQVGVSNRTETGLLMIDIDHFKKINDSNGHPAGDEVLQQVAKSVCQSVRPTDAVGRYGGEEFMVVLPDCSTQDVRAVGERVREAIAIKPMYAEGYMLQVTVSIGCTVSVDGGHFVEMLVKAADQALYRAKHEGRNRTIVKPMTPSLLSLKTLKR